MFESSSFKIFWIFYEIFVQLPAIAKVEQLKTDLVQIPIQFVNGIQFEDYLFEALQLIPVNQQMAGCITWHCIDGGNHLMQGGSTS